MIVELVIAIVGLLLSLVLFGRLRVLKSCRSSGSGYKISVIIPARNEEKSLPLLLGDLMKQTMTIHEIICVDDNSSDQTAAVAHAFGVRVVTIEEKPDGWTGKAFACQCGADASSGDIFLFLDADVRLSPGALSALVAEYEKAGHVISIQPYHKTERVHEQLSMFFNIVQVAANGLALPFRKIHAGLYGPVILIPREAYDTVGGHCTAKSSVTEDLALGEALKSHGIPFELYHGGREIAFRMYGDSVRSLFEGWTKNYATGALKMQLPLLLAVFIWVTACMSPPYHLVVHAFAPVQPYFWIYAALYPVWILTLWRITRPIGSFTILSVFLYPFLLMFFIGVFLVSLFKKLFGLPVRWKDRKIELRG